MRLYLVRTRDITRANPCWYRFGELFDCREAAEMMVARYQKFFLRDQLEYRITECNISMRED